MAPKATTKKRWGRRKGKKRSISLAHGETAQPRPGQGARNDLDRNPQAVALDARARHTGIKPELCRDEMLGCQVGRRLAIERLPDVVDLWGAVKHARKVYAAHARAIGAPARHPRSLGILAPPDALQASADSPAPDLREPDERDRAAIAAMASLESWLTHTDAAARVAFRRHVVDERDEPITDWSGVVMALRCVVDGNKGRRIRVMKRGRG